MARVSRKGKQPAPASFIEKVWNTALYARLSAEDSGRKGADTIESQIELIHTYANDNHDFNIYDTYVDNGTSGATFDRPAWNRLMDDIRSGKVNCIICKDLSRFGRNYIETGEMLEKIFPFMGVRFISVNDGYDSEKSGSKAEALLLALKNLVNDQYAKEISRKMSASRQASIARGDFIGTLAPYGYQKSLTVKNRLEPDAETAPIVRNIFQWRADGMSQAAICRKLDVMGIITPSMRNSQVYGVKKSYNSRSVTWQTNTIRGIIRSKVYIGHLELGKSRQSLSNHEANQFLPKSEWHIAYHTHEPIVEESLWQAANDMELARSAEFTRYDGVTSNLPENLLRGYLTCGICGAKLVRRHQMKADKNGKSHEHFHYICSCRRQHPKDSKPLFVKCSIVYDTVLQAAIKQLKLVSNLRRLIEKGTKNTSNPRALLDAEIARNSSALEQYSNRLSRLYMDYVDRLITEDEYIRLKKTYEQSADGHRQSLDSLSKKAALMKDGGCANQRRLKAEKAFLNPKELTRELLEALVEDIVVSNTENIKVVWKFQDELALLQCCADEVTSNG